MSQILISQRLKSKIQSVCPISEFKVGTFGDNSSVVFVPSVNTTVNQIAAGQAAVDSFDWNNTDEQTTYLISLEPTLANLFNQVTAANADIDAYLLIADTATAVQVRAEVKAVVQRQKVIIAALVKVIGLNT